MQLLVYLNEAIAVRFCTRLGALAYSATTFLSPPLYVGSGGANGIDAL
jgi:hypothetical protein